MSECRQYSRSIRLFVSGDLDEAPSDRLRAHLTECEDCAVAVARYREDRRLLARYARIVRSEIDPIAGEDWWEEIRGRVGNLDAASARVRRLSGARTWAMAAGLLVAAVIGFGIADLSMRPRVVPSDSSPGPSFVYPGGFGSEPVSYPIQNFSRPFVPQGFELDVDETPSTSAPDGQPGPRPRVRLLAPPPRSENY
ncbi:MAG: zf-HC2 domain-containing protein [Planctomycetes bacterium]|nr:zf-HC2 domain-containing protein [Planctomycetota bacterium]MBI3844547.1 zf-HC2 domain-containing protein [Planctomycetota bacterium]